MALFQLKPLDSLVQKASRRIDAALGVDDITARTDSLLTAREENGAAFGQASRRQIPDGWRRRARCRRRARGGDRNHHGNEHFRHTRRDYGTCYPGRYCRRGAFGIGAASFGISVVNYNRVKRAWQTLNGKIDKAVSSLVKATQMDGAGRKPAGKDCDGRHSVPTRLM